MSTTPCSIPTIAEARQLVFSPLGRVVTRAWMVILLGGGRSASEVAGLFGCHPKTVSRWRERFGQEGVRGLQDRPGRGRPRKATETVEAEVDRVLQSSLASSSEEFTLWTVVRLQVQLTVALGVQLSEATVRRTVHRLNYVWRRPRLSAPNDDPEKAQRLQEVAKTLEKAAQGEVVLYQDESTFRLLPLIRNMWMKVGQQVRIVIPKGWNRAFSVFLALHPVTGALVYELFDRHNGEAFVAFLEKVVAVYPDRVVHLILDNARYHTCQLVRDWLAAHPHVHLVYLPRRSPQANPVEDLWRWLKPEVAAHRSYQDLEPLRIACRANLDALTPEEALKKAALSARKGGQNL